MKVSMNNHSCRWKTLIFMAIFQWFPWHLSLNDVSRNNPVISLEKELHTKVNSSQAKIVDFRNQTGRQNVEANLRVLRQFNIPEKQIRKLAQKAVKHAQDLGIFE